jgi:hypothetical protein
MGTWFSRVMYCILNKVYLMDYLLKRSPFFVLIVFNSQFFQQCVWTGTHWSQFVKSKFYVLLFWYVEYTFPFDSSLIASIISSKKMQIKVPTRQQNIKCAWAWHFIYFFSYFRWHFFLKVFIDTKKFYPCLKYLEVELLKWYKIINLFLNANL